ncbi:PRA1 family protein 2 [Periophthalmus magnuspinnatus]|uniref:PRA1 family protein n=1 Tax=Periophthalmus magnuspinnatus TaxID=409849 RepID=A0A3B3ZMI9_9GOBI|nr:PRA1 family protein 2 [Periophthalmus magnuspinnatus]
MAGVRLPSLRTLEDFILGSARFAVPNVRDLDRWNNRVINNLLYYQSNYLVCALGCVLLVGYLRPLQLCVGAVVISLCFLGFVWAAENQIPVRRFRRNHPTVCVFAILLLCCLLLAVMGSVAVFLLGIATPILLTLVHASVRLRSLKNKLENKLESIGLKRTPMGLLLEALGQEQEAGS